MTSKGALFELAPCATIQQKIMMATAARIAVCQTSTRRLSADAARATWISKSATAIPIRTASGAWLNRKM